MVSEEARAVIKQAKGIYDQHRENLESEHCGRFVAIEPQSGEYFLGDTFDDAVRAARAAHPSRLSHTIRIGHDAAFHIGLMER